MDIERQTAGLRESLEQSLQSAESQYGRDVAAIVAQRDSRRNQAMDIQNRGYTQAMQNYQGLLPTIGNIASTGLQTYLGLDAGQKTFTSASG